jgi:hypothetical protein
MGFLNFPQQLGLAKPRLKAGLELLCANHVKTLLNSNLQPWQLLGAASS